jgi:hypothetical protein
MGLHWGRAEEWGQSAAVLGLLPAAEGSRLGNFASTLGRRFLSPRSTALPSTKTTKGHGGGVLLFEGFLNGCSLAGLGCRLYDLSGDLVGVLLLA